MPQRCAASSCVQPFSPRRCRTATANRLCDRGKAGVLDVLRPFGTASSFDPGPRHLAADRRNAYTERTTSLAT